VSFRARQMRRLLRHDNKKIAALNSKENNLPLGLDDWVCKETVGRTLVTGEQSRAWNVRGGSDPRSERNGFARRRAGVKGDRILSQEDGSSEGTEFLHR
jgi:hypothetical protein